MQIFGSLIALLAQAEPVTLVAMVSIVALLVIGECVRQFCKALLKKEEK